MSHTSCSCPGLSAGCRRNRIMLRLSSQLPGLSSNLCIVMRAHASEKNAKRNPSTANVQHAMEKKSGTHYQCPVDIPFAIIILGRRFDHLLVNAILLARSQHCHHGAVRRSLQLPHHLGQLRMRPAGIVDSWHLVSFLCLGQFSFVHGLMAHHVSTIGQGS
jgi:hypothetical protein